MSRLDHALFLGIAKRPMPRLVETALPQLASAPVRVTAAAALAAIRARRNGPAGVLPAALATPIAGATANLLLKRVVKRARPARVAVPSRRHLGQAELHGSFPSSHAATSFAFATAIAGRDEPVGRAALLLAAAISVSRVVAGDHYPSDVVAGAALGAAIGASAKALDRLTD